MSLGAPLVEEGAEGLVFHLHSIQGRCGNTGTAKTERGSMAQAYG